MTTDPLILAIDQGTTSSRALVFDRAGTILTSAQRELPQIFPAPGWVEHDAERIWHDTLSVARDAIATIDDGAAAIAAIGITNQRETAVIWNRQTGAPIHHGIVWQDRRTAAACHELKAAGHEPDVQQRTGLLLDPYFSATKITWLLDHVDGARAAADRGELAFGTIDSWLLWRLTGGRVHATDVTNAARTMLFNIHDQRWDDELLSLFEVPRALMPEVLDSAGRFGETDPDLFGRSIPITGIAGDQQAATFGQAAFEPGAMKSTYGTGCFALVNTGARPVVSSNRLLTTIAWRLDGETTYALEGSIFVAGAAVQWLRDGLGLISQAGDSEGLAAQIDTTGGVYMVPAFVGLGAPYWDANARGALIGLTRDTGAAEIARAALESVAYQTRDLMVAMAADQPQSGALPALRVDGGLTANGWAMQFLADILDRPVERPAVMETTALGAAYLAGLAVGIYSDLDTIAGHWRRAADWQPGMDADRRAALYGGWQNAVGRVLTTP
jgi:glycerol kinase